VSPFRRDIDPARPFAGLAADAIASLADAAGAAAPHAGLLSGRSLTIVVHRKPPLSEFHLNILCYLRFLQRDIIVGALN